MSGIDNDFFKIEDCVKTDKNLERQWCLRLIDEFIEIDSNRSLGMFPPNFAIVQSIQKLGAWDATSKTITISQNLILNYTWDAVVEVLKHEMAHQYVSEVLHGTYSGPHGLLFKSACLAVGVHPRFSGAKGHVPRVFQATDKEYLEENKYIKKIEKLFALAESAEEHEASAAMETANRLIARYNLEMLSGGEPTDYDYVQLKIGTQKVHGWTKNIAGIIRDFFFVKAIYLTQYDAATDTTYKAIEFLGRKENLAVAEHVFLFLHDRLEILWGKYRKKTGVAAKTKRSYYLGVLSGFRGKLEVADLDNKSIPKPHSLTISAMVVAEDQQLNNFFAVRYPRTKSCVSRSTTVNIEAYGAGVTDGKQLNMHKTIQSNECYQGLLLEN